MWWGSNFKFGIVCCRGVYTGFLLRVFWPLLIVCFCVLRQWLVVRIVCGEELIIGLVFCVLGQLFLVWYCGCWGSDYWIPIVCVVAVITGLVLFVVRQRLLVSSYVYWGSDYWLFIVCVGAVITGLVLCVV